MLKHVLFCKGTSACVHVSLHTHSCTFIFLLIPLHLLTTTLTSLVIMAGNLICRKEAHGQMHIHSWLTLKCSFVLGSQSYARSFVAHRQMHMHSWLTVTCSFIRCSQSNAHPFEAHSQMHIRSWSPPGPNLTGPPAAWHRASRAAALMPAQARGRHPVSRAATPQRYCEAQPGRI